MQATPQSRQRTRYDEGTDAARQLAGANPLRTLMYFTGICDCICILLVENLAWGDKFCIWVRRDWTYDYIHSKIEDVELLFEASSLAARVAQYLLLKEEA